jgi:hypothetical protein
LRKACNSRLQKRFILHSWHIASTWESGERWCKILQLLEFLHGRHIVSVPSTWNVLTLCSLCICCNYLPSMNLFSIISIFFWPLFSSFQFYPFHDWPPGARPRVGSDHHGSRLGDLDALSCTSTAHWLRQNSRLLPHRGTGNKFKDTSYLLAPSLLDCKHLFVPDYRSVRFNYCLRSGLRGSHCQESSRLRPEIIKSTSGWTSVRLSLHMLDTKSSRHDVCTHTRGDVFLLWFQVLLYISCIPFCSCHGFADGQGLL